MKKIFVLSVGRSDYDKYLPILEGLQGKSTVDLRLILSSAHYATKFGSTFNFIDKKFKIIKPKRFSTSLVDKPEKLINRFAEDLKFIAKNIYKHKPDILIVLGDRFEMLLAPIVSIPNNIPVIHFYGGAVTEGAVDELTRHAITKLSHYHFVALENYRKRLVQLGEEKWRIKVTGIHGVNLLKAVKKINLHSLSKSVGINLLKPYLLLTFHPVTLEQKKMKNQVNSIISAVKKTKLNVITTYPNADVGHDKIIKIIKKKLLNNKKYRIIKNCGSKIYSNLMQNCLAMVGNSSSGIVEAASFNVPVINIGTRQDGKFKPKNVMDCKCSKKDIYTKILEVKNKKKLNKLENIKNPYEAKISTRKIIKIILNVNNSDKILRKKFIDIK